MIQKKYQIEEERLGMIPYSVAFANAMNQGKLVPFLKRNYKEGRRSENRKFMEEAKQAARLLWKFGEKQGGKIEGRIGL